MHEVDEHAADHAALPPGVGRRTLVLSGAARVALLLGFSAYFFALYASGSVRNYVNPEFNWLVLVTAGLFGLLGLAAAGQWLRPRPHAHTHQDGGNAHWGLLLVVAVPVLLGVIVPIRPVGAAGWSSPQGADNRPRVADPPAWTIADWERAFHYQAFPESYFNGKRADMIGFVLRPSTLPPDHFAIGRYIMRHCIADVYGVSMLVVGSGSDMIPDGTWVHVQGTLSVETFGGDRVLKLNATQVDASIGQPDFFYLYPQNFAKW